MTTGPLCSGKNNSAPEEPQAGTPGLLLKKGKDRGESTSDFKIYEEEEHFTLSWEKKKVTAILDVRNIRETNFGGGWLMIGRCFCRHGP